MTECVCATPADVLTWQLLFLAMAVIALVLAILAEPISTGWARAHKWFKKQVKK